MIHLYLFDSHTEFEAAQPYLALPYVVFDGEHVHYSVDIPLIDLPLGSDGQENGYGWIDLKLPSGTKWAQCNIGATIPCEPGLLFQWGRVDGYAYGDVNNQFVNTNPPHTTSGKTYVQEEVLNPEDDAASVNMGGKWRMPTKVEMEELIDNTTSDWVLCSVLHEGEHTTMLGRLFVSKNDKTKKLFFPAAGRFISGSFNTSGALGRLWSSSFGFTSNMSAYAFYFGSTGCNVYSSTCDGGFSVRGVC